MAITVEYDSVRSPKSRKIRQALALPIYTVALIFSFVTEGLAILAAIVANDPH